MAPRKSPDEARCGIAIWRTTEFMVASQVGSVFTTSQQVLQDRAFQRGKFRRTAAPWAQNMDVDVVRDAAVLDHEDAVGQGDGFRYVMRHQNRGEGLVLPDPFEQPLHRDPRQG